MNTKSLKNYLLKFNFYFVYLCGFLISNAGVKRGFFCEKKLIQTPVFIHILSFEGYFKDTFFASFFFYNVSSFHKYPLEVSDRLINFLLIFFLFI